MADHSNDSVLKIPKLNASNHHERKDNIRSILVLRDLWFLMHDERPPAEQEDSMVHYYLLFFVYKLYR